jgi:hypothetical protein
MKLALKLSAVCGLLFAVESRPEILEFDQRSQSDVKRVLRCTGRKHDMGTYQKPLLSPTEKPIPA